MQDDRAVQRIGQQLLAAGLMLVCALLTVVAVACDVRTERRGAGDGRDEATVAQPGEVAVDRTIGASVGQGADGEAATTQVALDLTAITTPEQARAKLEELGIAYEVEEFLEQLRKGNEDLFHLFLKAGMDHSVKGEAGVTPLMAAVFGNNPAIVRELLELGADVRATEDESEATSLHYAAQGDPLLQMMGEGPAAPSYEELSATTGWSYDVRNAAEIARLLLAHDADIEARDMAQATPLLASAMMGTLDVAEVLLGEGADLTARDHFGRTALMLSVSGGNLDLMKLLVANGADLYATDDKGANALWAAVSVGNTEMLEYLLGQNVSMDIESEELWPTLHVAAAGIDPQLFMALEHQADELDSETLESLRTDLANRMENLRMLLEHGADPNERDPRLNATPLHLAADIGNTEGLKILLGAGGDVDAIGHMAQGTPLHFAAASGRLGCVQLLLEAGADATLTDVQGNTPLKAAAIGRTRVQEEERQLEEELALSGEEMGEGDRDFYASRYADYDAIVTLLEQAGQHQ